MKTELCANTIDDVLAAAHLPFTSIELNSGIEVDGLTPSLSFLKAAQKLTVAQLHVMIRPRTGGFCYSEALYQQMRVDAEMMLENGAAGIVFGFLNSDGTVNRTRTEVFADLAHSFGAKATFHKAIDVAVDWKESLEVFESLGIDRVLCAPEHVPLFQPYCSAIELVAGGGIKSSNVRNLIGRYELQSIHFTAKKSVPDRFGSYCCVDREEAEKIFAVLQEK